MKEIAILGRPIQLQERKKAQMKGVTIGDSLAYKFFDGEYHGMSLLFAEPKGKVAPPRSLAITASNLASLFQLPVVFLLPTCPAYERAHCCCLLKHSGTWHKEQPRRCQCRHPTAPNHVH